MIKTQEEYINACNFIDSDIELYDYQLSEKMSSYEYNLYLQDAEYFLDFLYEKTRVLEELCDYLDNYATSKIKAAQDEIDKKTEELESVLICHETNQNQSVAPDWDMSYIVVDRNGGTIATAQNVRGDIEGMAALANKITPVSIQSMSGDIPYKISSDFVKNGSYLSEHKKTNETSVTESLRIFLPNSEYNYIYFRPINADIRVTNQNKQYIDLEILSSIYKKAASPIFYDDYKDSLVDNIRTKERQLDALSTQYNNIQNNISLKDKIDNQNYLNRVRQFQQQAYSNNQKSETIQNTI